MSSDRGNFVFQFPIPNKNGKYENINFGYNMSGTDLFQLSMEMFGQKMEADITKHEENDDFMFNVDINMSNTDILETYDNDINIIQIHQNILNILSSDKSDVLDELRNKLSSENKKVKTPQIYRDRIESNKIIKRLTKEINDIVEKTIYIKYINESNSLLDQYKKLGPIQINLDFGANESDAPTKDDEQRNHIIESYIKIAEKYININIYKKNDVKYYTCPECDLELDRSVNMHNDGFMICPECSIEIPIFLKREENIESTSENITLKIEPDIGNFVKRIDAYSGIMPETYPSNLEKIIDTYFTKYGYITCEEIRNLPLNPDGRTRGNTSKKILESVLKDDSIQKLYEHSEWICFEYWGWVRHDISHLREKLLHDFKISQSIINENKGERKSNINREYRLFRHLEKLGYKKLDLLDFRMVKEKSLDYHENIWINKVVPELLWNLPPYNYNPVKILDM